ncbi:AMP-binding enzyme [Nocardioides sp. AE5]|uniref:AMP-binding enzyme n=1 Tax=Nocardioides sp. AE5 TaxID=2962573 RepID=UPI0028827F95|nr:hypothetical protein [Nocardioides sp. AE5]MDT0200869.1 hypothetical protein [Nocardioides sp. AE5]
MAEAAVLGTADPVWGEVGVAFVVARSGAALTEAEVSEHAANRLARFKVPHRVHLVDELPRTALGKVARGQLRNSITSEGTHHGRP